MNGTKVQPQDLPQAWISTSLTQSQQILSAMDITNLEFFGRAVFWKLPVFKGQPAKMYHLVYREENADPWAMEKVMLSNESSLMLFPFLRQVCAWRFAKDTFDIKCLLPAVGRLNSPLCFKEVWCDNTLTSSSKCEWQASSWIKAYII